MSDKQDLEPLLNAQQSQLNISLADSSSIENKALAILAGNTAILLFIGQVGFTFSAWWHWLVLLGPFLLSVALIGIALWPRKYEGPLIALDNHPEYLEMRKDDLILQLLADAQTAQRHNLQLNTRRWKYCTLAILQTILGAIILFAIL